MPEKSAFRYPHAIASVVQMLRLQVPEDVQKNVAEAVSLMDDRDRWVEDNLDALNGQITDVAAIPPPPGMPTGALVDFAAGVPPAGYLLCNGGAVDRVTFSELFAVIGTTWGAGDGSTTFNVPDFRGRATIGAGTGVSPALTPRALAARGGEETHLLTANESGLRDHVHGYIAPSSGSPAYDPNVSGYAQVTLNFSASTSGSGTLAATTAHNNMQPFAVVTKIIKT